MADSQAGLKSYPTAKALGANGEWLCRVCGNINFSYRGVCHLASCQAPRGFPGPYQIPASLKPQPPSAPWTCPLCNNYNRAARVRCHRTGCQVERHLLEDGKTFAFTFPPNVEVTARPTAPPSVRVAAPSGNAAPQQSMPQPQGFSGKVGGSAVTPITIRMGGGQPQNPYLHQQQQQQHSSAPFHQFSAPTQYTQPQPQPQQGWQPVMYSQPGTHYVMAGDPNIRLVDANGMGFPTPSQPQQFFGAPPGQGGYANPAAGGMGMQYMMAYPNPSPNGSASGPLPAVAVPDAGWRVVVPQ